MPLHRLYYVGGDTSSGDGRRSAPPPPTSIYFFLLFLSTITDTVISLQYQVNITVISDGGTRIDIFPREREALSTGSYRPGFCYVEGVLSAGSYTVVVSTYQPGQVRRKSWRFASLLISPRFLKKVQGVPAKRYSVYQQNDKSIPAKMYRVYQQKDKEYTSKKIQRILVYINFMVLGSLS